MSNIRENLAQGPSKHAKHECDLFLLSSHTAYAAERALPSFARLGEWNKDGWGIGSYRLGNALVQRSADRVLAGGRTNDEFATAVESTASDIILGHLRCESDPDTVVAENNHPFQLNFLEYQWLLVHNGTAVDADSLVPPHERLLHESTCDTPRVFEFLRKHIIAYYESSSSHSLIEACRRAFAALLRKDNGTFNIILSNGYLTFVCMHHRAFYLLQRSKTTGDAALLSTIKLTEPEDWVPIFKNTRSEPKMLVFCGPTLIFNGRIHQ